MISKKLRRRINVLEEKIAEYERSENKISALGTVCSLLGTDHLSNIQILVEQAHEILTSSCALYRRSDIQGTTINTWAGRLPNDGISEQMLLNTIDSALLNHDTSITGTTRKKECAPHYFVKDIHAANGSGKDPEMATGLSVAVVLNKKVIGTLLLFDNRQRQFSATDKRILSTLAKAIGIEEERRISERAIQESEERYRTILDDIAEGYYEVDLKGNFIFVSDTFCEIFGYTDQEILGKNYTEFTTPVSAKRAYKLFNEIFSTGHHTKNITWKIPCKDGNLKSLESSTSLIKNQENTAIGFRGIVRDVTKQRNLEFQLRQSQKMEAIGTLASGIAHDFNNILCIILGNTESALHSGSDQALIRDNLKDIRIASKRAMDLIKQILSFSRNQEVMQSRVRLGAILKESSLLLRATLPKHIDLHLEIDCQQDSVVADATQIHQVLLNLCTNAIHAMQGDKNGVLVVSLKNKELKKSDHSTQAPGNYVELQIRDSGAGISSENLGRIFDPYFTTKEMGKGTGMGLAIVHSIVKSHNGEITISSSHGDGTTFSIYLPVSNVVDHPPNC